MQTRYESSSNPSEPQRSTHLPPVKSIATSELSPAVKTSSLVALVAIVFGTLIGSLVASPSPEATIAETEETEAIATTSTETSPIVVEESEAETPATTTTAVPDAETDTDIATTPSISDTESAVVTPDSEVEITEPDVAEPTADATVSTPETQTSPASGLPAVTGSPDVGTTQPTDDPAATPPGQPDTLNPVAETGESEMAASTPETAAEATMPEETTAAETSEVNTIELSQSLYNQIDSTWISPVDGESAYLVKLNREGEIIGYEPTSQVAENNVVNTPLPELVNSDAAESEAAAEFEVVFLTSGILEVNETQSSQ